MTHSQALTLWQMLQCWQYLSCSFLHFFDGLSISFSVWQQNWTAVIQMRSNHTSIWQHKSGHCFFYWTGRTTPISFFSSHLNFLLVPCGRLSCLPISFYCTLNPHYRIVSYRTNCEIRCCNSAHTTCIMLLILVYWWNVRLFALCNAVNSVWQHNDEDSCGRMLSWWTGQNIWNTRVHWTSRQHQSWSFTDMWRFSGDLAAVLMLFLKASMACLWALWVKPPALA